MLRNHLTTKYPWYAQWHQHRYHSHLHWLSLGLIVLIAGGVILSVTNNNIDINIVKAAENNVVHINVDATRVVGKYRRLYRGINFMHHYPSYDKPLSQTELSRFKEIGFKYVRMMLPLTKIAPKEGEYHWGIDEYRMKQLTENGVDILVAPNYMPDWLSANGKNNEGNERPNGLDLAKREKYKKMIKDIIYHYKIEKGYNIKYFEVFNEYNLYVWSPDELTDLYRITAQAVKSVDSSILVGGPGTTGSPSNMKKFFTNIMDLHNRENIPLDFISWHNYYSTSEPSLVVDDVKNTKQWMKERNINIPVFVTEWAKSISGDKNQRLNFAVWSILSLYYQEKADLDKSFIWELVNPLAYTMLEYNYSGTPTPGFWAYKMLSELKNNLIFSQSDGLNDSVAAGSGTIATKDNNEVAVLVWNYNDTRDIQLNIKLPLSFSGKQVSYQRFVIRPY